MKKGKLITMAVSFLLTVGIVGAGFAAWVISADVVKEATGTVTVEEVIDKRINFTVLDTSDTEIYFGKPTAENTQTFAKPWFTNDADKTEDLVMTLNFSINNLAQLRDEYSVEEIKISVTIDKTQFGDAVNYIIVPEQTSVTESDDNGIIKLTAGMSANFSATLTFAWTAEWTTTWKEGETNKSSANPYNYFNSKDANAVITGTETYADRAKTAMEKIYELNTTLASGLKIKVTASVEKIGTAQS
jgi:hypothetical protein